MPQASGRQNNRQSLPLQDSQKRCCGGDHNKYQTGMFGREFRDLLQGIAKDAAVASLVLTMRDVALQEN